MANFIECNREQQYLLPPALQDWLPPKDLAWLIIDAVDAMDLSAFYKKYRADGKGQAAFEPSMMVALLLYAYSLGVRSSREIERLCERDIGFRVIAANHSPDHTTISRFRKENGEALQSLFMQVLRLCKEAGLVKMGVVALDGSKIAANAALEANRTYAHIQGEVEKMLNDAQTQDEAEDRRYGADKRGDEMPDDFADPGSRRARLALCKRQLEERAALEAAQQRAELDARAAEEVETGLKKRGRKPQAPNPEPALEAKANVTDPESRVMKTRGGYVQGYNGQAVVTEEQIILAAEVTQQANDVNQLHPMVEKARENMAVMAPEASPTIEVVLADAGYISEKNLAGIDPDGPEHLIATKNGWKQRGENEGAPRGRMPDTLTLRDRMARKLLTVRGRALYKKRGQMVEPVFGQIKAGRGIRHFMRRGLAACAQEWALICATHNLLKLWRSGRGILSLAVS